MLMSLISTLLAFLMAAVVPASDPSASPTPSAPPLFDTCPPQVANPTDATANLMVTAVSTAVAAPECDGCIFNFDGTVTVGAEGTLTVTIPNDPPSTLTDVVGPGVLVFDITVKTDCSTPAPLVFQFTPLSGGTAEQVKIDAICGVCCPI